MDDGAESPEGTPNETGSVTERAGGGPMAEPLGLGLVPLLLLLVG